MRERYYSEYDHGSTSTADSTNLPWFEIQILTITMPSSMDPELPEDLPDEETGGEFYDDELSSEHSVRVLGYKQAESRQEATTLYLKEKGFETLDQFLDGYSGIQDQTTELIAQDDMDAWVEVDPEEYLESFC